MFSIFKSRTFWTLVFLFVFNGFSAIGGQLSPEVLLIGNAILGAVATYYHVNPSQQYNSSKVPPQAPAV